jgi:hypothetical protein
MNYKTACLFLNINTTENEDCSITQEEIKQKYRIKALQYHPDKNHSPDAVSKFQEINESYEYLMKYEGFMDDENEYLDIDETTNMNDTSGNIFYRFFMKNNYNNILFSFLRIILKDEETTNLFHTIIMRITNVCQETAIETMSQINPETLSKIYMILKKYKDVLHLREDFMENIERIVLEKEKMEMTSNMDTTTENKEYIILNPLLDDLIDNNLYRLTLNGFTYAIPLWHSDLIYDNSGCDIHVKCFPILPENMYIDEDNDIIVHLEYLIQDIWEKERLKVNIGKCELFIDVNELKIKKQQTICFMNQGISKINTKDIYDISKKSNIYLNITIRI